MRLATIERAGGCTEAVALVDGGAVTLYRDGGSAYGDLGELLAAGVDIDAAIDRATADAGPKPYERTQLRRPVRRPGAIVCVGLNYRKHILEMGRELPEHPTLFSKLARALTDPYSDVPLPAVSDRIDYEGELAVVIGKEASAIDGDQAWGAVAGLTVLNDVTARDYQRRTLQWFAGKNFEASTPIGPELVTLDEIGDLGARELRVEVNGELRQQSLLGDLLFDVPALIADISQIFTLLPGDVIATGTPGGVGAAMDPEAFLADGDVVAVRIDGIGELRNRFVVA